MVEKARRAIGAGVCLGCGLLMALAAGVAAAEDRVERGLIVELFTSQACMYCPPADALLGDLDARDGVIGLSLNVPYWDFYGWRDHLARPEHQARQKAYQMRIGDGQPYTPQMVVQGRGSAQGNRPRQVDHAIAAAMSATPAPAIALKRSGATLVITAPAAVTATSCDAATPCDILLIGFDHPQKVEIGGGDNRDKAITYHNVVRTMRRLGAWAGAAERLEARIDPALRGYAVLLQEPKGGPIIAAAAIIF